MITFFTENKEQNLSSLEQKIIANRYYNTESKKKIIPRVKIGEEVLASKDDKIKQ